MLASKISPYPEEQHLITELKSGFHDLHRPLPYHGYEHPDEVTAHFLNFMTKLGYTKPCDERTAGVVAGMTHDADAFEPILADEPFKSVEERTIHIVSERLPAYGLSEFVTHLSGRLIAVTAADTMCENDIEKAMRRSDIFNIEGARIPYLANTVLLYLESCLLRLERNETPRSWPEFVLNQQTLLFKLINQDLGLSYERTTNGVSRFNRAASRNVQWLSRDAVLSPVRFMQAYGKKIARELPDIDIPELLVRVAA